MATTCYFEEKLYPANDTGRADRTQQASVVELFSTSYFGDDQIFLKLKGETLHLTKEQAQELAESLKRACNYIGYDNS